ncbi:hypothetical protein GGR57DRAFT_461412 [Xylariaceae sp. FL1272]|nr:hypothetical protein GGR57DRAFT_461412 [Xylariaceae sp. FL1272]
MHFTNSFVTLITPLLLASGAQATYVLAVYSDDNCTTPVENQAQTQVLSGTCDNNVLLGYKSIEVLHKWASPAGTITFYETNYCLPSDFATTVTYHNPDKNKCHNLGITASAVGLIG